MPANIFLSQEGFGQALPSEGCSARTTPTLCLCILAQGSSVPSQAASLPHSHSPEAVSFFPTGLTIAYEVDNRFCSCALYTVFVSVRKLLKLLQLYKSWKRCRSVSTLCSAHILPSCGSLGSPFLLLNLWFFLWTEMWGFLRSSETVKFSVCESCMFCKGIRLLRVLSLRDLVIRSPL